MKEQAGIRKFLSGLLTVVVLMVAALNVLAQTKPTEIPKTHTQVVLLGTGNPAPDPDRSGPATAIALSPAMAATF